MNSQTTGIDVIFPSSPSLPICCPVIANKNSLNGIILSSSSLKISMFLDQVPGIKYDLDRSTTLPKFDPTRVRTHDSTFHVTETPALTTWPSVIC